MSYEDEQWDKYRKNPTHSSRQDEEDIGEQIRASVAASTEWLNDWIADIRREVREVTGQVRRSVENSYQNGVMEQKRLDAQRKREEIRSRFGHISGWEHFRHWCLQIVTGGLCFLFGLVAIACFSEAVADVSMIFPTLFFVFLAVINGRAANKSLKKRRQLKRFVRYTQMIQDRLYYTIDDFVNSLGYSRKTVLRDLRAMIQAGILKQGHIDSEGKYLMMTDETYEQYLQSQRSYHARMRMEGNDLEPRQMVETEYGKVSVEGRKLTKEQKEAYEKEQARREEEAVLKSIEREKREAVQAALEQGRGYLKRIREANDDIPGEEISAKLDRLETVAAQIFQMVEKHPEKLSEIRKFMEYYLPTTLKLVDSYREFNSQPVQGENITKAKTEIEETLDMINLAFENLFDRLYQEAAMEVSADISVLQTLLAQEGLKEKDFVLK